MDAAQPRESSARAPGKRIPAQRVAPAGGAPAPKPPDVPRVRKMRLALVVLAGVVALLCVGGAGVVLVAYQRAAAPDRSAPDVAVDNYLRAYLVERNDTRARLFTCRDDSGLAEISDLRREISGREEQLNVKISVMWGSLEQATRSENRADVTVEIKRSAVVDQAVQNLSDRWRFDVRDEDGWRVCGARRI